MPSKIVLTLPLLVRRRATRYGTPRPFVRAEQVCVHCVFVAFEISSYPERAQAVGDVADVAEVVLAVVVFSAEMALV